MSNVTIIIVYFRSDEHNKVVEGENEQLVENSKEIEADIKRCQQREEKQLVFTQKMSDKNARLQAENTELHAKVNKYE